MEFEVWFAVDHRTSECGFVAASSLLAHRPKGSRTILRVAYVFGEPAPATWWPILLKKAAPEREIDFSQVPIDVGAFSNCKALFDSRAAFLRLLIPLHAQKIERFTPMRMLSFKKILKISFLKQMPELMVWL